MSVTDKKYYSWNEFDRDIKNAVKLLAPYKHQLSAVYGLPRGGLVVAVALSHALKLPLILDPEKIINEHTLIVDDIADTGKTMNGLIVAHLHNSVWDKMITFTLHYDNKSKFKPTVWINKKKAWTVYPWETKESSKYDGTI